MDCPTSFYPNKANCSSCHFTCLDCNGPLKNNCLSCKSDSTVIFQNECLEECPKGYYLERDLYTLLKSCKGCQKFSWKNLCLDSCPSGYRENLLFHSCDSLQEMFENTEVSSFSLNDSLAMAESSELIASSSSFVSNAALQIASMGYSSIGLSNILFLVVYSNINLPPILFRYIQLAPLPKTMYRSFISFALLNESSDDK